MMNRETSHAADVPRGDHCWENFEFLRCIAYKSSLVVECRIFMSFKHVLSNVGGFTRILRALLTRRAVLLLTTRLYVVEFSIKRSHRCQ